MEYLCGDVIGSIVYSPDNPKQSEDDMVLSEYEKAESRRRLIPIFEALGMDKKHSTDLAERHLKAYQGDEGNWHQEMARIKSTVNRSLTESGQVEPTAI